MGRIKKTIKAVFGLSKLVIGSKVDPIILKIEKSYRNVRDVVKYPVTTYINSKLAKSALDSHEIDDFYIKERRNDPPLPWLYT